jgi:LPS sulfotransferase NodH
MVLAPPTTQPSIHLPWSQQGYVRFLIIGDARTGSTLLVDALQSSPAIVCFAELFNVGVDFVPFGVEGYDNFDQRQRELRDRDPQSFLATRIYSRHSDDVRAVGFKLLYGQALHNPGLMESLLADRELHVVHLNRRNVLRLLVSRKIARTTGVYVERTRAWNDRGRLQNIARHPLQALGRLPKVASRIANKRKVDRIGKSVHVSAEELERFSLEHAIRFEANAQTFSNHNVLNLDYEDILSDRDAVFARTQKFLGVEPVELEPSLRRQNPEPLRDLVANYDHLKRELRNSPLAYCFDS